MVLKTIDPDQQWRELRARAIAAWESNPIPHPDTFLCQTPAAREQRLRRLAWKSGYLFKKFRDNTEEARTYGPYNLIDASSNSHEWHGDDLDGAEEWLKKNRRFY